LWITQLALFLFADSLPRIVLAFSLLKTQR